MSPDIEHLPRSQGKVPRPRPSFPQEASQQRTVHPDGPCGYVIEEGRETTSLKANETRQKKKDMNKNWGIFMRHNLK